jgi:phospholipase/carboxylesterase
MNSYRFILTLLFLVLLVTYSSVILREDVKAGPDEKPASVSDSKSQAPQKALDLRSIDIYSDNVDDFMNIDLRDVYNKATEAYQKKDYETSAKLYLILCKSQRTEPLFLYNLSCCYGLLGDAENSSRFLKHAFKAGFKDVEFAQKDPDFDKVRSDKSFTAAFSEIESAEKKKVESGTLMYIQSPAMHECQIVLPQDYSESKTYPLVIGLHGRGGNPQRFSMIFDNIDRNFIYACPQGLNPISGGSDIGYSWSMNGEKELYKTSLSAVESYVSEVATKLKGKYKIGKVYLVGFSEGAGMAYVVGIKHHELFDGIMCFGGWLADDYLTESEIKAAKDLPVFIGHGKSDAIIGLEAAQHAKQYLETLGYNVKLFEFEGGHALSQDGVAEALKWLSL